MRPGISVTVTAADRRRLEAIIRNRSGERVRLHGIDAPVSAQWCLNSIGDGYRCGQRASFALADKIGSQNIRCELLDRDQYDRHIGRCHLGDTDLNEWMVQQGQAVAYRRFSMEYLPAEQAARAEGIGLWQGEFDMPWDWRRGDRRILQGGTIADTATSESGCAIKGNISRSGERIYHVPGQQHYDRTRIDESSGERWFCSEEEARAAGGGGHFGDCAVEPRPAERPRARYRGA